MREHVIGIEFRDSLRNLDRLVITVQVLQSARQSVHGFGKGRIGGQRLAIYSNRLLQISACHEIERRVVEVLGFLAGVWVRHAGIAADSGFYHANSWPVRSGKA